MLNKIKAKLKQNEDKCVAAKAIMKVGRQGKKLVKFVFSREYRSMVYLKLFHANRTQQTTRHTSMNRYPNEFTAAKEYFESKGEKNIRILSYGCCTGEEVVTLREYFPEATIVGAEINKESLRICRKRKLDDKIFFIKSVPATIMKYGPYDMVLAMAVLERTPHLIMDNGIEDLSDIYPYEKYEKQIFELDTYVKPGGLFVSANTHYFLLDTPVGNKYIIYGNCGFVGQIFDKSSKLKINRKPIHDMFTKKME